MVGEGAAGVLAEVAVFVPCANAVTLRISTANSENSCFIWVTLLLLLETQEITVLSPRVRRYQVIRAIVHDQLAIVLQALVALVVDYLRSIRDCRQSDRSQPRAGQLPGQILKTASS
jgi:hypothetical protein